MSKTFTAEEFLNNDLKGTHQVYDETGVTLITGIEHSEVCRIMEDYANYLHKAKVESITYNPVDEHLETSFETFFENWMVENKHEHHNIPIDELLTDFAEHLKQKLLEQ